MLHHYPLDVMVLTDTHRRFGGGSKKLKGVVIMAYRKKMSKKSSQKQFRRGANRVQRKNVAPPPMRGGTRL